MVFRLQSNRQYYNEHDRNLFRNMANVRGNPFAKFECFSHLAIWSAPAGTLS